MVTRAKSTRKKIVKKPNILVIETKNVPLSTLQMYHKNPRIGDVEKVAKSLHVNSQFKPIVVNIGTHTGRKNEILAGNHTYLAARRDLVWTDDTGVQQHKEAWTEILVAFVDVNENDAKKIVLADNHTSDDSSYDDDILAQIFASIEDHDYSGTGYEKIEVDDILAGIEESLTEEIENYEDMNAEEQRVAREERRAKTFDGAPLGEEGDMDPDEAGVDDYDGDYDDDDDSGQTIEGQSENLPGLVQFKPPEETIFEGAGYFGIPKLRNDMLMTFADLPDGLATWAGSASKDDDDPDRWWLYNWGVDSTSGMKDISKVILSFYTYDDYFDNWWYYPERYMAKVMNSKIKYLITPNWSQTTELPKVEALWNLYRSRWVGRYAQEAGLKVCPDVTWIDGDAEWLEKYVLGTLPKGIPLISLQLQTIDPDAVTGGMKHFKDQVRMVFEKLEPEGVLLYSGSQGRDIAKEVIPKKVKVKSLETRQSLLSEHIKGRTKKKTI